MERTTMALHWQLPRGCKIFIGERVGNFVRRKK